MKNGKAVGWILGTLTILLGIAWALVLWVAVAVSTTVLHTLEMIVELAGITP